MKHMTMGTVLGLLFSSCMSIPEVDRTTPIPAETRLADFLIGEVDVLCLWTGATRTGTPRFVRRDFRDETDYYIEVDLRMRDFYQLYDVYLDRNRKIWSFMPRNFMIHGGFGPDNVKDVTVREDLLRSISQLNKYLKLKYYGKPAIQKIEDYYLVTFSSLSPEQAEELEKTGQVVIEAVVNFLLTEDYRVFGVFAGA